MIWEFFLLNLKAKITKITLTNLKLNVCLLFILRKKYLIIFFNKRPIWNDLKQFKLNLTI